MKTESSVEINRPINEVFDFTTNHVAEWSIIVVECETLEEKPEGMGTTFRIVTEESGRRMEFEGVTTRHEPPNFSAVHMTGKCFDLDVEYQFEDLSGRTRLTQRSAVKGKGFFNVMFFLCGWAMRKSSCKAQENELNNLKRLLESRESQST
jgi:hypothetical protein